MKILAVTTLVSPHGEYGGPVRVAVNQLRALAERGHEVLLTAGTQGFETPPSHIDGVPVRLFPAHTLIPRTGFAGLSAPSLLRGIRTHVREFDIVHVHAARDLLTLPAARIAQQAGVPTLLQCHGMIDESTHPLHAPFDAMLTRRALRSAVTVTYLTPVEKASLETIGRGHASLAELRNGVPLAEPRETPPSTPHILYLARLAPRKRPLSFVRAASALLDEFPSARFTLVGPDEGEGDAVRAAIAHIGDDRVQWRGPMPPEQTLSAMQDATLYVLPSVDEPFPMSVLEAMSVGLPVIVTDTCGLAPAVAEAGAGDVIDDTQDALVHALRHMLADPVGAAAQGRRGRDLVASDFSMRSIAERLEALYTQHRRRLTQ